MVFRVAPKLSSGFKEGCDLQKVFRVAPAAVLAALLHRDAAAFSFLMKGAAL